MDVLLLRIISMNFEKVIEICVGIVMVTFTIAFVVSGVFAFIGLFH